MISTRKRTNKICAVIPFFNEEKYLNQVVQSTLKFVDAIIAVNDGSTDDSLLCLNNISGITVMNIHSNTGKGYALQQGFNKCIELGFDEVITIDGDGQHKPEYIPLLLKNLETFDIVIGNRLNDVSSMPIHRRLSNKLTSYFLSKKLGIKITDSQCGFRAYKIKVLQEVRTDLKGFEAESEILVKSARKNFSIGFVDIPTIYADEKSKMKSFQAIKGFIKVLLS